MLCQFIVFVDQCLGFIEEKEKEGGKSPEVSDYQIGLSSV